MIAPSLAEEGCIAYRPYVDPERADRVIIVEEWADSAALEHHFTLHHFKHVAEFLDEISPSPSPAPPHRRPGLTEGAGRGRPGAIRPGHRARGVRPAGFAERSTTSSSRPDSFQAIHRSRVRARSHDRPGPGGGVCHECGHLRRSRAGLPHGVEFSRVGHVGAACVKVLRMDEMPVREESHAPARPCWSSTGGWR